MSVLVFSIDNSAGQGPMPGAGTKEANSEHSSNPSEDGNNHQTFCNFLRKVFAGKMSNLMKIMHCQNQICFRT